MKKYCAFCGATTWGMVRYAWWRKQFCTQKCRQAYLNKVGQERERLKRWLGFISQPPQQRL
jgi:hypothetical protein